MFAFPPLSLGSAWRVAAQYLQRVQDEKVADGDTAVNLERMDPLFGDHLDKFELLVMLSNTHWPHAKKWLRRFFVDYNWGLLSPQPDTYAAYE